MTFKIKTSRTGVKEIEFGRINVFLGANGTGKSKLLAELRGRISEVLPDFSTLNIEGGRAIQMFDSLELNNQNFSQYRTFQQTFSGYKNKRQGLLQNRIFDALKSLEQQAEKTKIDHSDAITKWHETNSDIPLIDRAPVPVRQIDPMTRVFETFTDIFPSIDLSYNPDNRRLTCVKKGSQYGPTGLSDGEKQVFSILVDIIELSDDKSVLLVDEPELNLNPGLANRLWTSIESLLPSAVFIYATHSVNFASRDEIDHLLILSNEDDNIQELSNLHDLTPGEREELVGAMPSLLANKKTIVVEGQNESFDNIFYSWILGDKEISPSAVGSCEDVIAIASRAGKWRQISPNVDLVGVIDRDYRPESELQKLGARGVNILAYHEAESYLCEPDILVEIAEAIGTAAVMPSTSDISTAIVDFANKNLLKTIAKRSSANFNHTVGISISSKVLSRVTTENQIKTLLTSDVLEQMAKVSEKLSEDAVTKVIENETDNLKKSILSKDVVELLKLCPGKELLASLAPMIGCVDSNNVARAARHHLDKGRFPRLVELESLLLSKFGATTSVERCN